MKNKKDKTLVMLGIVYIFFWFVDFIDNAVLPHNYSWILWYSATGFLLTGIALIIQNVKFTYSLFCALFVIETLWIVDLFFVIFSHHSIIGLTEYVLSPSFHIINLYFTFYHALTPVGLLMAVMRGKETYQYGWVGAVLFVSVLLTVTAVLLNPASQVNCIHSINKCHTILSFLYQINTPARIFIVVISLTVLVYIPTNYILLFFKRKSRLHFIKSV